MHVQRCCSARHLSGDAINMAFGNSVGLPTPETGQWYAFVLLAEILGVQAGFSDVRACESWTGQ